MAPRGTDQRQSVAVGATFFVDFGPVVEVGMIAGAEEVGRFVGAVVGAGGLLDYIAVVGHRMEEVGSIVAASCSKKSRLVVGGIVVVEGIRGSQIFHWALEWVSGLRRCLGTSDIWAYVGKRELPEGGSQRSLVVGERQRTL